MRKSVLSVAVWIGVCGAASGAGYEGIAVGGSGHAAIQAAARILAANLGLPESAIHPAEGAGAPAAGEVLLTDAKNSVTAPVRHDGYAIVFRNGGAAVYGVRPRSLLYAAAD